jgi:predicted transcriptional regulator
MGATVSASASIRSGVGSAIGTKQQMLRVIEELPEDASIEDALDRLYLRYKIERGLRQADGGELVSQEEVRQCMAKWVK